MREYCLTQSKLEKSKSEEPAPKDNGESVKEPVGDGVKSDEISGSKNQEQQLETKITPAVIKKWAAEIPKNQNIVGGGSGFAISDDGYFLTNHHVVEGCDGFEITYNDLSGFGEVFAQNKKLDLAVVKVEAPTPYFAKFDLSELRLGEKLIALGYPVEFLFGDEASISEGALTNTEDYETRSRREGFLLTSLPIASGNSGGPVYSAYGGIRGVVSYGFNSEKYKQGYKEEYGEDLPFYINTINFNFMVSGIKAKDWLTNSVNLDVEYSKSDDEKLATDEVASIGLKALARVDCLED